MNNRTKRLNLRLTEAEFNEVMGEAEKSGGTLSHFLRSKILQKKADN